MVMVARLRRPDASRSAFGDPRKGGLLKMEEITPSRAQIDDRYLAEWLEFGFREISAYLDKQARFARYLNEREADL
jgi:hypothetical protein